ncbi:hypothetical protein CsSME_00040247 [Camellia sinensis var. sinensis]
MTERKENIVMFPFMAQGHIIPFLALALELEKKNGYTITFVNTRLNIKKLRPSIPPNSSIRLLEIPFNSSDHGLPPDSENTDSLPFPLLLHLITSSPASSSNMAAHHFALFLTCSSDGLPKLLMNSVHFMLYSMLVGAMAWLLFTLYGYTFLTRQ